MKILVDSADTTLFARLERALPKRHTFVDRIDDCDLLILDDANRLPELRARHRTLPILVITPEDDLAARVSALEVGADDALAEPWAASQMSARVSALARRAAMVPADPDRIEADGCLLDFAAATAERDGKKLSLSAREIAIVRWLLRHAGRPASREELLEHVWEVAPGLETRSVDVAIAALRKKIERDPAAPQLILSVRGLGYAWGLT